MRLASGRCSFAYSALAFAFLEHDAEAAISQADGEGRFGELTHERTRLVPDLAASDHQGYGALAGAGMTQLWCALNQGLD